jgi:hypothetical protein
VFLDSKQVFVHAGMDVDLIDLLARASDNFLADNTVWSTNIFFQTAIISHVSQGTGRVE